MTTDWNKLTVVELRGELKKRGLVQTGKKAELVERLLSSAENDTEQAAETGAAEDATDARDTADEPQAPELPTSEQGTSAAQTSTDNNSLDPPNPMPEGAAHDDAEPPAATEPEVAPTDPESLEPAQVDTTTSAAIEPVIEIDAEQAPAEAATSMDIDEENIAQNDTLPAVGEAVQDTQSRKRRSRTPSVDESTIRKRARQDDVHFVAVDTDMKTGEEPSDAIVGKPHAPQGENAVEPATERSDDGMNAAEKQGSISVFDHRPGDETRPTRDLVNRHSDDVNQQFTRYDEDVAMEDHGARINSPDIPRAEAAEAADAGVASQDNHDAVEADHATDERFVAPAIHPATSALYIKNLMRPLGNAVLEEYLVDLATPPSQQPNPDVVVEFYVDNIKSHAFVQFNSVSAASRVRSALHDQVWPDERNRKALWVDFIPAEKVRDWIEQEKSAGQGRGNLNRFEVMYEADAEGIMAARLAELGPDAARQNARAPPTGPASSAIPTGPRGFGIEGAPLGPRGNGGRMGPPTGPRGAPQSDEGFKQTRTYPQIMWKPVSEDLAMRRIDNMRSHYTTDRYRDLGKPDEINRYFFENGDRFVDRGKEVFVGIRPPHREAERRRAAASGDVGGRRGLPPAGRDVDRYVGGRSSGRDDFTPRSRFNGAPLPTFDGRSDRRGRNGGYRR